MYSSMESNRGRRLGALLLAYALGLHPGPAFAQASPAALAADVVPVTGNVSDTQATSSSTPIREARDDAWWTGPMLANSAETLPPGHFLIEPYFYDVATRHTDGFGSRAYMLYGLADRFTVGFIPIVGYNRVSGGPDSSGIGAGDVAVLAQYRLTEFHEGSWMPTISVQLQQAFPTGKYDRLGDRPSNGLGSGAHATTLGLLSQTWFWLPNGRILRMRFNVSQTLSGSVNVQGTSVYGTDAGFLGTARPGAAFSADTSLEYSFTRNWVLALDVFYAHNRNTRVTGQDIEFDGPRNRTQRDSGPTSELGYAPAIEYSWTSNLGVLVGVRVIPARGHAPASLSPAVAINYVH